MPLVRLTVEQFRCLAQVELSLDSRYNLFVGPNASGKTSLLEALFLLGRGRSFRSRGFGRLVRQGAAEFRVVGWVEQQGLTTVLGVGGTRHSSEIRIGGAPAGGAAELAAHFPPLIIDPEVHKLLEDGPPRRRRFLDWGVFHVEPSFMETWQRYHRALKQRNAALKLGADTRAARIWEPELASTGERLATIRQEYLALLGPVLADVGRRLLDEDVTVVQHRGWPTDEALAVSLERSFERDVRYRATQVGPHRADVSVRVGSHVARERVSRGQQKLLAAALTLAQLAVQEARRPGHSALLLDDPAAELDASNLARLLDVVRSLPVQLFVTALRPDLPALGEPGALFHVERGEIRRAPQA
jgi:DNA replication and repair protein RecF